MAVAAKDSSGPDGFLTGTAVVESVERAMSNQHAHDFAVRTWCEFEPLDKSEPVVFRVIEPSLVAHIERRDLSREGGMILAM